VRINGRAATIIGVMPGFNPVSEQLWVPLYNEFPIKDAEILRPGHIIGRLKPGVSTDQVT
jgi:hypothetical protein